jgi:hypothetical protein
MVAGMKTSIIRTGPDNTVCRFDLDGIDRHGFAARIWFSVSRHGVERVSMPTFETRQQVYDFIDELEELAGSLKNEN